MNDPLNALSMDETELLACALLGLLWLAGAITGRRNGRRLLLAIWLLASLCLQRAEASAGCGWTLTYYHATGDRTRTGEWPYFGGVSVDPRIVPLGSLVYIAAYDATFLANDTGGGVQGRYLDVFEGWKTGCTAAWIVEG